jgi:hypothetical protein
MGEATVHSGQIWPAQPTLPRHHGLATHLGYVCFSCLSLFWISFQEIKKLDGPKSEKLEALIVCLSQLLAFGVIQLLDLLKANKNDEKLETNTPVNRGAGGHGGVVAAVRERVEEDLGEVGTGFEGPGRRGECQRWACNDNGGWAEENDDEGADQWSTTPVDGSRRRAIHEQSSGTWQWDQMGTEGDW